jgi:hypothetical protein
MFMLTGCAGRAANPIMIKQFDDQQKTCAQIKQELLSIENNVQQLVPQADKTSRNVALGVSGAFFWPLWLFMDLKSSEKEEIYAYRNRYHHLVDIAQQKNCEQPKALLVD